jgi:hypothetical protein
VPRGPPPGLAAPSGPPTPLHDQPTARRPRTQTVLLPLAVAFLVCVALAACLAVGAAAIAFLR